ncbi:MAG TPA: hypothetical protein VKR42_10905 [Ktedonobacteraceae bacterium]|nr:hypothetical protein [Ktedonobacteraceae bacterium]
MQIATVNVTSTHPTNLLGLVGFLVVWIVLFECAHLLIMLLRNGPLIAWAISPLGVTVMFLREPSMPYIWLNVFFPALISGSVVYFGLFSSLAPITLPHTFLIEIPVVVIGILLSSTIDFVLALRDTRYPLWGEARILRSIQYLRASWASIHFTSFGLTYLRDHFGSSPSDLLQAL